MYLDQVLPSVLPVRPRTMLSYEAYAAGDLGASQTSGLPRPRGFPDLGASQTSGLPRPRGFPDLGASQTSAWRPYAFWPYIPAPSHAPTIVTIVCPAIVQRVVTV